MTDRRLTIGGVLYPGFEMLDLFGPLEMYSLLGPEQVELLLISETLEPVHSAMGQVIDKGPRATPDHTFDTAPQLDVVVLPGGFGTLPQLENTNLLNFLKMQANAAQIVSSVCTGSALLARAGLLEGRRATSNKQLFKLAADQPANVNWVEAARWVEDGKFFTSSGVSAGMDMTLAAISHLLGEQTAEFIATAAEYSWHRDASVDPFVENLNDLMT